MTHAKAVAWGYVVLTVVSLPLALHIRHPDVSVFGAVIATVIMLLMVGFIIYTMGNTQGWW